MRLLRKLRGRSSAELLERGQQSVRKLAERVSLGLRGRVVDAEAVVPPSLRPADARTVAHALSGFRGLVDPRATAAAIRDRCPRHVDAIVHAAERIEQGFVPMLGLGDVFVGPVPRWHVEPRAHVEVSPAHWSRIEYLDPAVVGDHKVLWEFNRHQYLLVAAQAWLFTSDERWLRLVESHVDSWRRENPAGIGVNWASSLEVAYRAIAWCWLLALLRDAPLRRGFVDELREACALHARHVARNLSTYFSPNTHLTGEALALCYVGASWPELPDAAGWWATGAAILHEHIARQVSIDGIYFEQATQYQRYSAEIYLHLQLLQRARGEAPPATYTTRLSSLFRVLDILTRSDGTMPLLGDDDGGLLLPLDTDRPDELQGLLAIGALSLTEPELLRMARVTPTVFWMCGANAGDRLSALRSERSERFERAAAAGARALAIESPHAALPNGGWFVLRDRDETIAGASALDGHLLFDLGPHGAMNCGHAHADALAVELFLAGRPLLVDAGTFGYVGPARNEFRAASSHNVLSFAEGETSVPASGYFGWSRIAHPKQGAWHDAAAGAGDDHAASMTGTITVRLPDGAVEWERTVSHPHPGLWVIVDRTIEPASSRDDRRVDCNRPLQAVLRWRLGAGVVPVAVDGVTVLGASRDGSSAPPLATIAVAGELVGPAQTPGWVSRRYGERRETTVLEWSGPLSLGAPIVTVVADARVWKSPRPARGGFEVSRCNGEGVEFVSRNGDTVPVAESRGSIPAIFS